MSNIVPIVPSSVVDEALDEVITLKIRQHENPRLLADRPFQETLARAEYRHWRLQALRDRL